MSASSKEEVLEALEDVVEHADDLLDEHDDDLLERAPPCDLTISFSLST
jgi:hypothetical protein